MKNTTKHKTKYQFNYYIQTKRSHKENILYIYKKKNKPILRDKCS